ARSGELAVAVLVFLARAAGTGIVAADLLAPADRLRYRRLIGFGTLLQGQRDILGAALAGARDVVELGVGIADVAHRRRRDFLDALRGLGGFDAHGHE